jgi:hypothetical protein
MLACQPGYIAITEDGGLSLPDHLWAVARVGYYDQNMESFDHGSYDYVCFLFDAILYYAELS